MGITHVVQFQFKSDVSPDVVKENCHRMLALEHTCLHPDTQKPYLKSVTGGKDNSIEGIQNGITHAFVVEFENDADRQYYCHKDPSHLAFVKGVAELVEKVQVVDFTHGIVV
ncbi:Dabb family protein [Aspergillus ruber CBS 135680]|uniref:Stress responsive A/B barrel domain protein n=1 Tax=Aspergillus ruber (strain CBS 135680) TaxID=1388766 RepID=A0A017SG26_ASPRC|nr:stress responsive A/B barrel domain protein [Aspergillus ruber CBS 135680]EYE95706.1 stress responsive A/B barrel domain protein [Aspergillus ruber CBS 135680]